MKMQTVISNGQEIERFSPKKTESNFERSIHKENKVGISQQKQIRQKRKSRIESRNFQAWDKTLCKNKNSDAIIKSNGATEYWIDGEKIEIVKNIRTEWWKY